MAKSIGFNITLNVNGKDTIVKCKTDAQNLSRALRTAKASAKPYFTLVLEQH